MTEKEFAPIVVSNDFSPLFEMSLYVRDAKGGLTDKKRSYTTDNPQELARLYERHTGDGHRRNKKPVKKS